MIHKRIHDPRAGVTGRAVGLLRRVWAWHWHQMRANAAYARILADRLIQALWQDTLARLAQVVATALIEAVMAVAYGRMHPTP